MVRAQVDTRSEFDSLAGTYLAVAIVVAVLVLGAIAFMVLRYRAREGRAADRGERSGGSRIEVAYAAALALIAAGLLAFTFTREEEVDPVAEDPATTIRVTAFQWGWRFEYPGGRTETGDYEDPPVLAVPVGETVRFELTARDVIHAFWIPSERFKRDAFPDRTTEFDLVFDQLGVQHDAGRCAEFCGFQHGGMLFDVLGLTPQGYRSWLDEGPAGGGDAK